MGSLITRALLRIIVNQEKFMADLNQLQAAVTNLSGAVNAVKEKMDSAQPGVPSVAQADLDPVVQQLDTLTATLNGLVSGAQP